MCDVSWYSIPALATTGARTTAQLALCLASLSCASAQQPAPPPQTPPPSPGVPSSIAEASAACDRLQANAKVPVTCTTDYVDNVPSMIVGFRNVQDAERWLQPFAEHIGLPFCNAANRNGREARVYMTVGEGADEQARRWSCELGKWGDWFATNSDRKTPEAAPPPPQTIASAIRTCSSVQANREVPVSCQTEYVNGIPSMIIGFPTPADLETYLDPVADHVAGPFCDAANSANRRASLIVVLANSRARHFDCERQQWSEWFRLPEQKASDRSSL